MVWSGAQPHGLSVSACPLEGLGTAWWWWLLAWALKMEKGFCEAEKVGRGSTGSGENMGMDPRAEEVRDQL